MILYSRSPRDSQRGNVEGVAQGVEEALSKLCVHFCLFSGYLP